MSPALERMAKRAALPISVQYYPPLLPPYVEPDPWPEQWLIRKDGVLADFAYDQAEASAAYLRLCEPIDPASSPASIAADCSASSPLGMS